MIRTVLNLDRGFAIGVCRGLDWLRTGLHSSELCVYEKGLGSAYSGRILSLGRVIDATSSLFSCLSPGLAFVSTQDKPLLESCNQ